MTDPLTEIRPRSPIRKVGRLQALGALGLLCVGVAAYLLWASFATRRSEEAAMERALAAGRWREAEALVKRSLGRDPDSPRAHFLLARVALALGRPAEALDEAIRARSLGYPEKETERLRALVQAKVGRFDQAESVLRSLRSETNKPDPEVDEALAKGYIESFQFGLATEVLDRWMREAPGAAKPYLWRTQIWRRTDNSGSRLISDCREALRRDPNLHEARLGLAEGLRKDAAYTEAAEAFTAYLARKPDDPAGHLGAGRTAVAMGDTSTAVRHFDRALELAPNDPEILLERTKLELHQSNFKEALAVLDRAEKADPAEPQVPYLRSLALAQLGQVKEAQEAQARSNQLRDDNLSLQETRKALVKSPGDLPLQAEAARWLIEHGHAEEGLRWAKRVLSAEPDHPGVNHLLAHYYDRAGNPALANFYRSAARTKETSPAPAISRSHPE
jgi:Flp pilus assembly protein TadD